MKIGYFISAVLLFSSISATAYTVGEQVGQDVFLYNQQLDPVYSNSFFAHELAMKRDPAVRDKWVTLIVTGNGKTVDFKGSLNIDCSNLGKSNWNFAKNFDQDDESVVPAGAIKNAVMLFCR